jgi:hypothetical protein
MEMIWFQNIWLNGKDFLMQNLPGIFFEPNLPDNFQRMVLYVGFMVHS